MKRFLSLLFVCLLALCLVACGGEEPSKPNNPDNGNNNNPPAGDPSGDPSGDPTPSDVKRDVKVSDAKLSNILGEGKLYVTTFGQASWKYMQDLVGEAVGEAYTYTVDNQLGADAVNAGDVVLAVVGYTTKGISAEITQTGEIARAKAIAEKEGVKLIVCQIDGKDRRGSSSDPIIEEAVKGADYVLIYDAGNDKGADFDKQYSNVWCKDMDNFFMFSDEVDMIDYFKALVVDK